MNVFIYPYNSMSYIAIGVFTDISGGSLWSYRAFSSTDPDRPLYKIKRDIYYHMGYQLSYPNDKNTFYGWFHYLSERICDLPLEERENGIRCVIRPNHTINTDYAFIEVNDEYSNTVSPNHGQVCVIPHRIVEPNLELDTTFAQEDLIAEQAEDTSSDEE